MALAPQREKGQDPPLWFVAARRALPGRVCPDAARRARIAGMSKIEFRPALVDEAAAISALVLEVFEAFVAPHYGAQGHLIPKGDNNDP